jgi:uncharacterized membrane protein YkoI
VAKQLKSGNVTEAHPSTVQRALKEAGLKAKNKVKKPKLQNRYKKLKYEFAKKVPKLNCCRLGTGSLERRNKGQ